MRILEIETYGRGGLIHYAFNLSCALAERGHQVTLLTTAAYELADRSVPPNLHLVKGIARLTSRPRTRSSSRGLALGRSFEAVLDAFRVAAFARRLRPDVVHFHSTNNSAIAYLVLLRMSGIPVVTTAHVVTPHEPGRTRDAMHRRIHRLGRLVIAHSDFDRRRLIEECFVDPQQAIVIPHGEYGFFERGGEVQDRDAARQSLGLGERDEVVLFFGFIREYKGLDVLLESWPAVTDARPAARLVVAGDASRLSEARRGELRSWASRLGAVHRFEYIPFSEVARYFAAADVLAMPYRHISQSGVLYLALSLGVPVVATTVGALPEVLRHEDSALLVPPESPALLADALRRVLGDSELRGRLAQGGRRLADEHSWPAIAAQTERAFVRFAKD
jgi:glycosyltransferase involved in cell wall biosynthesis